MAKKQGSEAHPWQALEEEAYHAFREWPIWLVLRERELGTRLDEAATRRNPAAAQAVRPALQKSTRD